MYRVASMFAGIGGICLGFKQAGYEIVWANEVDKAACRTYRHNFGGSYLNECDVRNINIDDIPPFDVLAAGFPCQPFSIAGRQRGFNDKRGNLFFEIAKVIDKRRPRVVFLENVPNLIEHDNGKTFLVIYTVLAQYGYTVCYRTLFANEYGNVPQVRNRVYIAAFKNLEDCDSFRWPEPVRLTKKVSDIIDVKKRQNPVYYYQAGDAVETLLRRRINEKGRIYNMFGGNLRSTRHGMCPTLVADMGRRPNRVPVVKDDFGYRKLTLRECLDFQGFPKDFYFPNTITIMDAYKQIGNSVCVPVICRIAGCIAEAMDNNPQL